MAEYLAQNGEQMMCLHVHKGSCRQNFVPWTVRVGGWLKRIRDQGVRAGGRLVPVLGTDAHLLGVCTCVQGYVRGCVGVSVHKHR